MVNHYGKMKFRIKSISNQFSFLNNFFIFHFFQILFALQSVTNFVTLLVFKFEIGFGRGIAMLS